MQKYPFKIAPEIFSCKPRSFRIYDTFGKSFMEEYFWLLIKMEFINDNE